MENVIAMMQQITKIGWRDIVDIVAVALLIYMVLPLFRNTGTTRIAKVLIAAIFVAWLTDFLEMHTLSFIIDQFLAVGLIALVVLFQPELRRMIDHLGNMKFKKLFG